MKTRLCCLRTFAATAALFVSLMIISPAAKATFHEMQIYEVIGGVNGDTSVQAIELRMRAAGQNFLSGASKLVAVDATGSNPVTLIAFGSNVANGAFGDTVLITTANFGSFTNSPGTFANDFTLTNTIPASYLNAGRLLYETTSGQILWSLAFGGVNYTGPTNGETVNGVADPGKYGGPLPSLSTQALVYQGVASGTNANNATDYALTSGVATFTNNAGMDFQVVPEPSTLALFGMGVLFGSIVGIRARLSRSKTSSQLLIISTPQPFALSGRK